MSCHGGSIGWVFLGVFPAQRFLSPWHLRAVGVVASLLEPVCLPPLAHRVAPTVLPQDPSQAASTSGHEAFRVVQW